MSSQERAIIQGLCATERSRHADDDVVPCEYILDSAGCRTNGADCAARQRARANVIRFELQKAQGEAVGLAEGLSAQAVAVLLSLLAGDRWVMGVVPGDPVFCREIKQSLGLTVTECVSQAEVHALSEVKGFVRVRTHYAGAVSTLYELQLQLTEAGIQFAKDCARTPYDTALMALNEIVAIHYGGSVPAHECLRKAKAIAEEAVERLEARKSKMH